MLQVIDRVFKIAGAVFFSLGVVLMSLIGYGMYKISSFVNSSVATVRQQMDLLDDLSQFRHAALTKERGKAALQVAFALKDRYSFHVGPPKIGPKAMKETLENSSHREAIEKLLEKKGFYSIGDWVRNWYSLLIAINFYVDDNRDRYRRVYERIHEMEAPLGYGEMLRPLSSALVPPRRNVRVVRSLLVDKEVRERLLGVMRRFERKHEEHRRFMRFLVRKARLFPPEW